MPTDHERIADLERQLATAAEAWRDLTAELLARDHARRKFFHDVLTAVLHTVVVLALIAAAVVLAVTGNDATLAWTALGGYIGGSAVERTARKTANGASH